MSTNERIGRRKVVQPPPEPPPRPQEQQQFGPDQDPRRRQDGVNGLRKITHTNLPSLSTRDRPLAGTPSARRFNPRQLNPTRSSLLLLIFAILTAPSLWPVFDGMDERGSGFGIGVRAAECSQGGSSNLTVTNASLNYTMFDCENGDFNVYWHGVVNVSRPIYIGQGTTVRIFGTSDIDSGDITSTSVSDSTSSSSSSSTGVDLEFELERLSSNLNLPQNLTSVALGGYNESLGPIFFVNGGELYLESMTIRGGYSSNSSDNSIRMGGGINAYNATISANGSVFEDNFASYIGGGIHANRTTLIFRDTIFRRNHAGEESFAGDDDADSDGGGIAVSFPTPLPSIYLNIPNLGS